MTDALAEQTRRAAQRFYDLLNGAMRSGDLAALDEVLAPDVVDHSPDPNQAPGREGIKRAFGEFRAAFPDLHMTAEVLLAEGDRAACRVVSRMTHRGEFAGVAATGRAITQTGIDVLRLVNGRLVERWGEFDNLGLLRQLGALAPSPPPAAR